MKKIICIFMAVLLAVCFVSCGKAENRADTSLKKGEIKISGTVEKVQDSLMLLKDGASKEYSFSYGDGVEVVEDGWYVTDYSADHFEGKKVTVICSENIAETYPMQLMDVRMIILE